MIAARPMAADTSATANIRMKAGTRDQTLGSIDFTTGCSKSATVVRRTLGS